MRFVLALSAYILSAAAAQATKRPGAQPSSEMVKLKVVGYRTDGIDTSELGSEQLKFVRSCDIKSVSHPSSRYYAVETTGSAGEHTFLASEISVAVGKKIAKFTGAAANAPEGSSAILVAAARQQVSPQRAVAKVAGHGRRHH
jgi:hypothetical protein